MRHLRLRVNSGHRAKNEELNKDREDEEEDDDEDDDDKPNPASSLERSDVIVPFSLSERGEANPSAGFGYFLVVARLQRFKGSKSR